MTADAKAALRRELRLRRSALDRERRAEASLLLRDRLISVLPRLELRAGAVVAGYRAIRDEIDPEPALAALQQQGFALALPAVVAKDASLVFRAWSLGAPLAPDRLGIAAPPETAPERVPVLVLVPLLGFDRAGHRLGYGAGFYDRTLAALPRPPLVALGLGFALQEVDRVPASPTDARLDGIVTERRVFWVAKDWTR